MAFWEGWCWWRWRPPRPPRQRRWLQGRWRRWRRRRRRRLRLRRGLNNEDIEFLKMELRSIHGALRLVGAVPSEQLPPHLKRWADQSREVSYDIQDILDTFLVRVEGAHPDSSKGLVSKMARPFLRYHRTRREIAEAIIDVKILVHEIGLRRARYTAGGFLGADAIRVQEIAERHSRYQADTIAASANPGATSVDTGPLDLVKDETQLVGAGRAMEEVIGMLSVDTDDTSNHQLKTVCIVGVGGSGKTTLARAVYQRLQPRFDCSAFVSLSMSPNIVEVLSRILQQLDNGKHASEATGEWDEERLVYQLRQLLQDKRYLIAVDDIWDVKSWEEVRGFMVDNDLRSRIITTTRIRKVAEQVGGAYVLSSLSNDESKHLFYGIIFGSEGKYHDDNQLDGILDKILKKCSGSPLAIVTIATLLARTPREEWYEVLNRMDYGPHEGGRDLDNIRRTLMICYYDLPSHLRPCFLYISMFPEDYEFRRDRLVWRWVAEGFIQGKQGCSLFQIGQKYLDELLFRRFIREVDKDDVSDGMTKYCRVHDLLLDLSCSLASDENFVTILVNEHEEHIFLEQKVRRLSLQNSQLGSRAHTLKVGRHVRSVAAFDTGINLMPPLSSFHILRVLDLEGCNLTGSYYNNAHLGKLLHLRYLGLRGTNVSQLPKDIGNLRFMEILDLKGTRIRELPSTVALLHRLLCLYAEPETRVPKGMGNLTSLEELTKVSISESPSLMEELTSLVELRVLDIVLKQGMSESSEKDFVKSLCNLHELQSLGIYGHFKLDFLTKEGWAPPPGLQRFVTVDGWFSELPTWICDARNLSELQIGVRELWREGLQSLRRLRELRFLSLAVEHMGERLAVDADAFPNLTHLRLNAETCLVFRQGAMPKLEVLKFVLDVDKANGDFDWGLSNLGSLQKVTVKLRTSNGGSANEEAEAALMHAVESHPNRPRLEVTTVTSQNKQIQSVDDGAGNVASSSEIQEERYAL